MHYALSICSSCDCLGKCYVDDLPTMLSPDCATDYYYSFADSYFDISELSTFEIED